MVIVFNWRLFLAPIYNSIQIPEALWDNEPSIEPDAVIDCGDPTANMSSQNLQTFSGSPPSVTTFSSVLVIVCAPGSYFLDFSFNRTIICSIDGEWTPLPFCGTYTCLSFSHFSIQFLLNYFLFVSPSIWSLWLLRSCYFFHFQFCIGQSICQFSNAIQYCEFSQLAHSFTSRIPRVKKESNRE